MDTSEDNPTAATRINGALMANYLQAKAIIVGYVTKVDPDGKRATLKTTDDQFIQVVFQQPLNFPLQPNQLLEVFGKVLSRNQFECASFSHFMPDVSEKFNNQTYNKFIKYFLNHNNRINITSAPNEEAEPVLPTVSNDFEINWNVSKENQKNSSNAASDVINDYDSWN